MIRRAREELNLTQHQLALQMGTSQSQVARWETGDHEVSMGTLARIARALNVRLVITFSGKEAAK